MRPPRNEVKALELSPAAIRASARAIRCESAALRRQSGTLRATAHEQLERALRDQQQITEDIACWVGLPVYDLTDTLCDPPS